jgi:nicotinate-nucleotide adenylyltransferase
MKIGLYGGTFDPVHNGHLILARDAVETLALDRLVFIPNVISPHRLRHTPAPAELRLAMIRAAIADEPRFEADDIELARGGVSYTIDTVLALREKFPPGTQLVYLIGGDNFAVLEKWHRIAELKRLVDFAVLSRADLETAHPFLKLERRIDISATEIRTRVAKGDSIRYLVPDAVREIIAANQLYKETPHQI